MKRICSEGSVNVLRQRMVRVGSGMKVWKMRLRAMCRVVRAMRALPVLAFAILPGSIHAADRNPNGILILADDLGAKELGCYGHTRHRPPNLDRMAAEEMRGAIAPQRLSPVRGAEAVAVSAWCVHTSNWGRESTGRDECAEWSKCGKASEPSLVCTRSRESFSER